MPLQLDLRHYETVVAITELGTMTAAAELLHSSQSALSHRLAEAERRLGTALFERGPRRRLLPTRAGLMVHQAAGRALADLERTEHLLLAEQRTVTATVRIAVGSYDCYHWFPAFLRDVRAHHPTIDLQLVVIDDQPSAHLATGSADLVIAPGTTEGIFDTQPLFLDELVLCVSPQHRLAGRRSVEATDLTDEFYLTYNPRPAPGFEFDRFIGPAATYPRTVTVVEQTNAIAELVAADAGVSILSRWALSPMIDAGRIVEVRCGEGGLPLEWNALVRPNEKEGSPTRLIADELARHLDDVVLPEP
ncbi:MAG: LysR family transcriptional regulator [Ilumatobacter sp.]|uniref:LysR family transcriptional regulator n=3 Tax=Ilumatobacter sp. TaxID=1967498 RepID=UPI0032968357